VTTARFFGAHSRLRRATDRGSATAATASRSRRWWGKPRPNARPWVDRALWLFRARNKPNRRPAARARRGYQLTDVPAICSVRGPTGDSRAPDHRHCRCGYLGCSAVRLLPWGQFLEAIGRAKPKSEQMGFTRGASEHYHCRLERTREAMPRGLTSYGRLSAYKA
jgi:hypothetical protein